jgi:O-antigen/teichoic acid export membrane protein
MIKAFLSRFSLDTVSKAVILAINILIARKLSVSDYGVFTYSLTIANLLYIFTEIGMNTFLLKEVGKDHNKVPELWPTVFTTKLFLGLSVFITAAVLLPYLWPLNQPWLLFLSLGWMIGNSFSDFYQTFCTALHNFKLAAKLIVSTRALLIAATAIMFILDKITLTGIIWVYFSGSLVGAVIASSVFARNLNLVFKLKFNKGEMFSIIAESFPIGVATLFNLAYLRADTVILTWIKGTTETGIYGAAYKLFEMFYIVPVTLMVVAMPLLARAKEESLTALKRLLSKTFFISFIIALIWALIGYAYSDSLIALIYNKNYLGAAPILKILTLANAVAFFAIIVTYALLLMDKQRRNALNHALTLIVCVLLNVIFIYRWGAMGAAYAALGTQLFILLISSAVLIRTFKEYQNKH